MCNAKTVGKIRHCITTGHYEEGEKLVEEALKKSPASPVLHNLMGILKEKQNHYVQAEQFFRKACSLDPSYEPARENLKRYGIFCPFHNCAYSEERF